MPAGVVKSKRDEEAWARAKREAGETYAKGDKAYWPVVMTIYKKMTGRDAEERLSPAQAVELVAEGVNPAELVAASIRERTSVVSFSWDQDLDSSEVETLLQRAFPSIKVIRTAQGFEVTGMGSATFASPDPMALLRRIRKVFPQKLAALGVEARRPRLAEEILDADWHKFVRKLIKLHGDADNVWDLAPSVTKKEVEAAWYEVFDEDEPLELRTIRARLRLDGVKVK
jgi:hypothetical protein